MQVCVFEDILKMNLFTPVVAIMERALFEAR